MHLSNFRLWNPNEITVSAHLKTRINKSTPWAFTSSIQRFYQLQYFTCLDLVSFGRFHVQFGVQTWFLHLKTLFQRPAVLHTIYSSLLITTAIPKTDGYRLSRPQHLPTDSSMQPNKLGIIFLDTPKLLFHTLLSSLLSAHLILFLHRTLVLQHEYKYTIRPPRQSNCLDSRCDLRETTSSFISGLSPLLSYSLSI